MERDCTVGNIKRYYDKLSNISASLFIILLEVDGKASSEDVRKIKEVKAVVDAQVMETYNALATAALMKKLGKPYDGYSLNEAKSALQLARKNLDAFESLAAELSPSLEE